MVFWTISVIAIVYGLKWLVLYVTDVTDPKGRKQKVLKPGEKPGRWDGRTLDRVWFVYYLLHIVSFPHGRYWSSGRGRAGLAEVDADEREKQSGVDRGNAQCDEHTLCRYRAALILLPVPAAVAPLWITNILRGS